MRYPASVRRAGYEKRRSLRWASSVSSRSRESTPSFCAQNPNLHKRIYATRTLRQTDMDDACRPIEKAMALGTFASLVLAIL